MFGNPNFGMDFPVQEFRDNSVGSFLNPFMDSFRSLAPASSNYMDFASQGPPTYEENRPSFWRSLLGGIAGGVAGLQDPLKGIGVAQEITDQPYMRAVQQYMMKKQGLGEAAKSEMGMLGMAQQFQDNDFQRQKFHDERNFNREKFQTETLLNKQKNAIELQKLENTIKKDDLDRALTEKRISIDQYQASIQAMNAGTQRSRLDFDKANQIPLPFRIMGVMNQGMGGFARQPSAALTNTQLKTALTSDPLISRHMDDIGRLNTESLSRDPTALQRYNEISRGLGLPSSGYTAPAEEPGIWDRLFGNE